MKMCKEAGGGDGGGGWARVNMRGWWRRVG